MLNYKILGQENEETIIFIHGLAGNINNWKYQENLKEKFKLVMVDLQGFGKSEIEKKMTIKNHAILVKKIIKELKLRKIHLVGLSVGGLVAQEIMKTKQKEIKTMTIISSYESLTKKNKLEFEKRTIKKIENGETKGIVENMFFDPTIRENILCVKRGTFYTKKSYIGTVESALEVDFKENNKNIDIPTLLIYGRQDKLISKEYGEKLNKSIKNSKIIFYDQCGHLPNIEKSEEFNKDLELFITKNKKF